VLPVPNPPTRLTMPTYRGQYLSARPVSLPAAPLSYDDLLRSPATFAGSPREDEWMCFPRC
jgi:hypothetical protein